MLRFLLVGFLLTLVAGCGDPPLNPIDGKVTLDGKPYERLLVYFRPIGRKVDSFRMGVGETDRDGNLGLRSSAGDGLAAGKYRVSFNCYVSKNGKAVGLSSEKADDDRTLVTEDIVPEPYNDPESSPVEFTIQSGTNTFEYDIPSAAP